MAEADCPEEPRARPLASVEAEAAAADPDEDPRPSESLDDAAAAAEPDDDPSMASESPEEDALDADAPDDEAADALASPDSPPTTATVGGRGWETTFSTTVLTVVFGFGCEITMVDGSPAS